jgi:hypothetical protein
LALGLLAVGFLRPGWSRPAPAEDGKPRIICIGAHPDDAVIRKLFPFFE